MYERHTNRERYFQEQVFTTEKHVIPYIQEVMKLTPNLVVAEIGCGEGGNLKPFLDLGCKVIGIDLSESKIANGEVFFAEHPLKANLTLVAQDIYEVSPDTFHRFDLVIMRDTIEHIHDQDKFMEYLKQFLNPGGKVFFDHKCSIFSPVNEILNFKRSLVSYCCQYSSASSLPLGLFYIL
ncbi:MAG: class I SAM-dependent methyltransferase, partial [Flavobacteriia bacterium]|nr:class I SAM-dependent methyltransferase [Flavobacteriia bacterium]